LTGFVDTGLASTRRRLFGLSLAPLASALAVVPATAAVTNVSDTAAKARRLLREWLAAGARSDQAFAAVNALSASGASLDEVRDEEDRAGAVHGEQLAIEDRIATLGLATLGRSLRDIRHDSSGVVLMIEGWVFLVHRDGPSDTGAIPPGDVLTLA
jgi:hypothetical protein